MAQRWERLAFLHWPVDTRALSAVLPPGIEPDEFDGSAWIGVTPFAVCGLRLRVTPSLASFPEINVRTYVTPGEKPGIWFLSLDTSHRMAVHAARKAYRVPYHHARQAMGDRDGWVEFSSERDDAVFAGRYRPTGPVEHARPNTFEHFMAERYCLYTLNERQQLLRGDIEHNPWPLQPAEAEIADNTMARPYDIELTGSPRVHYADELDVRFWTLTR